jgi:hypothetical protein
VICALGHDDPAGRVAGGVPQGDYELPLEVARLARARARARSC